jgi:RHS repeat-associated protein
MSFNYSEGNDLFQGHAGQRNGNISGITLATNLGTKHTYAFEYDALNRLTQANHKMKNEEGTWTTDRYGEAISYDAVGNILGLRRNGVIDICPTPAGVMQYDFGQVDDLTYTIGTGNRLLSVTEASNQLHGFKGSGTGFSYDGNGNMLNSSQGGGILHYNHLNLPYKFQGGGTIEWLYDASGMKHQKKTTGGPPDENYTKDYILGIEYKDGQIESIMHPEGRAVWFDEPEDQEPGKFIYEYNLKDHLGNVRVVFADKNEDGFIHPFFHHGTLGGWFGNNYQDAENHEIIQENHYYPFGMAMEGAWENVVPEVGQDYKYNGKEMQSDFGLDWLDYGARFYDAAIGRWGQVDPLAEISPNYSAYVYVFNNPIGFNDPTGMIGESIQTNVVNEKTGETYYINDGYEFDFVVSDDEYKSITKNGRISEGGMYVTARWLYEATLSLLKDTRDDLGTGGKIITALWVDDMLDSAEDLGKGNIKSAVFKIGGGKLKKLKTFIRWIKKNGGQKLPGTAKGGAEFKNDGRGGTKTLPKTDSKGKPITYTEYDINPTPKHGNTRGEERIVIGSDGKSYYTKDHYQNFTEVKE